MEVLSIPYQYVNLKSNDNWLDFDENPVSNSKESYFNGDEAAKSDPYLTEDEIRLLNSDFNYKHYSIFIEKMDGRDKEDEEEEGG